MKSMLAVLAASLIATAAQTAPIYLGPGAGSSASVELVRGGGSRGGGYGGSQSVRGHTTRSGSYVASHRATNPDSSRANNWTARGNVNPNNGRVGTRDPYRR